MRLIDADKIDFSEVFGGQSELARDIRKAAQGYINKQPTVSGAEERWILVEERLPEEETRVLCQFDNGDIELLWQDWENAPETLRYISDMETWADKTVIAWQPLPEPYHPKEKEEGYERK